MMQMVKLDMPKLKAAFEGGGLNPLPKGEGGARREAVGGVRGYRSAGAPAGPAPSPRPLNGREKRPNSPSLKLYM